MRQLFAHVNNLGLKWKFIIAFYVILFIPMICVGIYIYRQTSLSIISQTQSVMQQNLKQTRDNLHQKVVILENIADFLVYNSTILSLLESPYFGEASQIESLNVDISALINVISAKNKMISRIRIFFKNEALPEMWDDFYNISRVANDHWYKVFDQREQLMMWRISNDPLGLPRSQYKQQNRNTRNYSFNKKIVSFRSADILGILQIEVDEKELFDSLINKSSGKTDRTFIMNKEGTVVSNNIPELYNQKVNLPNIDNIVKEDGLNSRIETVDGVQSIVATMPIDEMDCILVSISPTSLYTNVVKHTGVQITITVLILSFILGCAIFIMTSLLLKRLKCLLKAMKKVRDGNLNTSLPISSKDEFGELAINFNLMIHQIRNLIETVYKMEVIEKEAELKALEAQINPHFLYNTLTTISFMAKKAKAPTIINIANSLAKFYRLVLNKGSSFITMQEEIEQLQAYIDIQKIRFGALFDIVYNYEDSVLSFVTIKNFLQPLVENALHHGIEPKGSHGTILVCIKEMDGRLEVSVIDDGIGVGEAMIDAIMKGNIERKSKNGYALKNINERFVKYYGEEYTLNIFSRPGIGTTVRLAFPKSREPSGQTAPGKF